MVNTSTTELVHLLNLFDKDVRICQMVKLLCQYYEARKMVGFCSQLKPAVLAVQKEFGWNQIPGTIPWNKIRQLRGVLLAGSSAEGCVTSRLFGMISPEKASGNHDDMEALEFLEVDLMIPFLSVSKEKLISCDDDHPGYFKIANEGLPDFHAIDEVTKKEHELTEFFRAFGSSSSEKVVERRHWTCLYNRLARKYVHSRSLKNYFSDMDKIKGQEQIVIEQLVGKKVILLCVQQLKFETKYQKPSETISTSDPEVQSLASPSLSFVITVSYDETEPDNCPLAVAGMQPFCSFDFVPSIRVTDWLDIAREWVTRERKVPLASDLVDKIVRNGCFLVPKDITDNHRSSSCDAECTEHWRISFSYAEEHLARARTRNQEFTYFSFKSIIYRAENNWRRQQQPQKHQQEQEHLKRQPLPATTQTTSKQQQIPTCKKSVAKLLKSYFAKTTFLWACEELDVNCLASKDIQNLLLTLFKRLDGYFSESFLPHYFIRCMNLLREHAEEDIKAVRVILGEIIYGLRNSTLLQQLEDEVEHQIIPAVADVAILMSMASTLISSLLPLFFHTLCEADSLCRIIQITEFQRPVFLASLDIFKWLGQCIDFDNCFKPSRMFQSHDDSDEGHLLQEEREDVWAMDLFCAVADKSAKFAQSSTPTLPFSLPTPLSPPVLTTAIHATSACQIIHSYVIRLLGRVRGTACTYVGNSFGNMSSNRMAELGWLNFNRMENTIEWTHVVHRDDYNVGCLIDSVFQQLLRLFGNRDISVVETSNLLRSFQVAEPDLD